MYPSVSRPVYPELYEGPANDLAARRYRRTVAQLLQQGAALRESVGLPAAHRGGAA